MILRIKLFVPIVRLKCIAAAVVPVVMKVSDARTLNVPILTLIAVLRMMIIIEIIIIIIIMQVTMKILLMIKIITTMIILIIMTITLMAVIQKTNFTIKVKIF
jgi:hypothetical protein